MAKALELTKTLKTIIGVMGAFSFELKRVGSSNYKYIFGNVSIGNIRKLTNRKLITPTKMAEGKIHQVERYGLSETGWESYKGLASEFTNWSERTMTLLTLTLDGPRFVIDETEVYIKQKTDTFVNVHDIIEEVGYRVKLDEIGSLIKDKINEKASTGSVKVLIENGNIEEGTEVLKNRVRELFAEKVTKIKTFLAIFQNSLDQLQPKVEEVEAEVIEDLEVEAPKEEISNEEPKVEAPKVESPEVVAEVEVEDNSEIVDEPSTEEETADEVID